MNMTVDIAQTVVSVFALLTAVYAIVLQRHSMNLNSKLNAAATLFNYYNLKISSLRNSIIRDTNNPEKAKLEPLSEREKRLEKLLSEHEKILSDLESLYREQK